jgi:hypothetical protein
VNGTRAEVVGVDLKVVLQLAREALRPNARAPCARAPGRSSLGG